MRITILLALCLFANPVAFAQSAQGPLALRCINTKSEMLDAVTILCHFDCGGKDMTAIVKVPNRCPLYIDV